MDDGDPPEISLPTTLQETEGPLVSVVTPTYEDARYIERALESLSEQTYANLEVVVVDSSGVEWLETLLDPLEWARYVYEPPNGVAAARNRGLDEAEGEVIAFLDADDFYAPAKLERQVAALDGEADVVYSNVTVIEPDGSRTELSALPVEDPDRHHVAFFRSGHGVPTVTVAARRECFEDERFDERLQAREDPHLWVRLFRNGIPAMILESLAFKRRRADSLTADPDMMYENELAAIDDLVERIPELRSYRVERERMAAYRYGKHLFQAGRTAEARRVFLDVLRSGKRDAQTLALFGLSLLPAGNRRAFRLLERVQQSGLRALRGGSSGAASGD
ncbi:glycosyltransferase [Halosimplex litoreum]|uniref:Glycosyltransferase n=1 Tax=Halosimplex litoreum TaxID=1198301 RepID=A0A7T3FXS0_9EURY|nr:glycosyltransferase [Halosimplex litoreum]QPV62691.1 glycosyltransferase [Halosimplex litoreum]